MKEVIWEKSQNEGQRKSRKEKKHDLTGWKREYKEGDRGGRKRN